MTSRTKWILGIVSAAAAGVALGMLLAPERGADMRRRLSTTAGGWAGYLGDMMTNAKGEVQQWKGRGTRAASDVARKFSHTRKSYS